MKVVMILSDALRYDYIQYMPFLSEMSKENEYYKRVIPGIGFCEISEYVSGLDSLSNGNLFQITFNGKYKKPIFTILSKVNSFFNHIPRIRRYSERYFDKVLEKKKNQLENQNILRIRYNIPLHLLDFFTPTESKYEYDSKDFFPDSNFFSILSANGFSYDIDDFVRHNKISGSDGDRIERLVKKVSGAILKDFTLIYIGVGEIAHITGTQDCGFHKKLEEYDYELKKLRQYLDKYYREDYRLIILGDHGMVDVDRYINIYPIIHQISNKYNLRVGYDFMYFIDSTAFRLWFKNKAFIPDCDRIIRDYLKNDLDGLKINNSLYGDLIYLLKPGNVFYPDFFNRKKNKGMHGYNNRIYEQHGQCIIIGEKDKNQQESIELHNFKDIILKIFGKG